MYSGKLHIMYVNYSTHRTTSIYKGMKFEVRAVKIWIAVFKVLILHSLMGGR